MKYLRSARVVCEKDFYTLALRHFDGINDVYQVIRIHRDGLIVKLHEARNDYEQAITLYEYEVRRASSTKVIATLETCQICGVQYTPWHDDTFRFCIDCHNQGVCEDEAVGI
jgi:hypothetical protein